jgi:hypothetical protein
MTEFIPFPKMGRLSRECIITEKIDGTNAQVFITPGTVESHPEAIDFWIDGPELTETVMLAGSRTRWISPENDNFGFATWAQAHAKELRALGPGRHFGEWWGSGIQRGYGLPKGEKRFSLFNTIRWCLAGQTPAAIPTADPRVVKMQEVLPACCGLVPVLYRGPFTIEACESTLFELAFNGSQAAPGFKDPEGIVVFPTAANVGFKKTIKNDSVPKSIAA